MMLLLLFTTNVYLLASCKSSIPSCTKFSIGSNFFSPPDSWTREGLSGSRVKVNISSQHWRLPWALSMAVMPPSHHSAAPTQEDSPRKSMVLSLQITLHAPQPTTQSASQPNTRRRSLNVAPAQSTSLSCCQSRAGGGSDSVVSSESSIVSLGHRLGQEGRGEAEDRRNTHLATRARPHTSNDYDDPPTVTKRLVPRNLFLVKISGRLGSTPHAP